MTAALIMPDSLKETNSVHDVSCAGYYSVPIGLELENTLTGALSQVFERWTPLPTERMGRAIMM